MSFRDPLACRGVKIRASATVYEAVIMLGDRGTPIVNSRLLVDMIVRQTIADNGSLFFDVSCPGDMADNNLGWNSHILRLRLSH